MLSQFRAVKMRLPMETSRRH